MLWVSQALTPCSWSGKISVSPENYSLAVTEGSAITFCVRASPELFLCSICKISHTLPHTCINTCTPKMRLLPGRTDSLGCYRAGSSQHPLGGAGALQYSQTVLWDLSSHGGTECCLFIHSPGKLSSLEKLISKALYSLYSKH